MPSLVVGVVVVVVVGVGVVVVVLVVVASYVNYKVVSSAYENARHNLIYPVVFYIQ